MRRTTPDLLGRRQQTYVTASRVLLALTIGYVLWTNYVVFVGGNLPLTPIDLGEGSSGAGIFMLAIGDLIAVMVIWFLVDAALLNLLHLVLRTGGGGRRRIPVPNQGTAAAPAGAPGAPVPVASPFASYPPAGPAAGAVQQGQSWNAPPAGAQQGSTLVTPPGSAWPPPPASGPDRR